MTKRDWLRTCKRFEARVEGLKLDAIVPVAKITSQKSAR